MIKPDNNISNEFLFKDDASLDFRIHLEYSFANGLRFSSLDDNGVIMFTDTSLQQLLRHLSSHINALIFTDANYVI